MIKSKFIKENDIISLKPEQFRKFKNLHITLYDTPISIPKENIEEFFLNNNKTIIKCKISYSDNIELCHSYVENYFYNNKKSVIKFSYILNIQTGYPENPYTSDSFGFLFINEELILNILVNNSEIK